MLRRWLLRWLAKDESIMATNNAISKAREPVRSEGRLTRSQNFSFMECENGYIIEYLDHRNDEYCHFVCRHGEDITEFLLSSMATIKLRR